MTTDLPELNEANAPAGTPLKPYEITYDRAAIERHCGQTGEAVANYERDGTMYVPTGLLAATYGRLIHETFFYTTGVHVSSDLKAKRPALAGETLHVSGTIAEHFERNNNKYVRFSIAIEDDKRRSVANVEHVSIYKLAPKRAT
jgi:acyl dehydratase